MDSSKSLDNASNHKVMRYVSIVLMAGCLRVIIGGIARLAVYFGGSATTSPLDKTTYLVQPILSIALAGAVMFGLYRALKKWW